MKKIILLISLVISNSLIAQVEEIEVEEIEVAEVSYESRDIVQFEIDRELLVFKRGNLYGIKDKNENILIKPIFDNINHYKSTKNRIFVSKEYGKWGIINLKGKVIIPLKFNHIYELYHSSYIVEKGAETLLYDYYGNLLLKNYESIGFLGDYIKVKKNEHYGVLSPTGKEIIPTEYDEINYNKTRKRFLLKQNDRIKLADIKGENIFKEYDNLKNVNYDLDVFYALKKSKWGVVNEGETVVPFKFDEIKSNQGDSYIVKFKGKWGVYNVKAKDFIIPNKYDNIKEIESVYILRKGSEKHLKTTDNRVTIDITGYELIDLNHPFYYLKKEGQIGVVDAVKNKIIIPVVYDNVSYSQGFFRAEKENERYDIYNSSGKKRFESVKIKSLGHYQYINQYRIMKNGKAGLIYDQKILNPEYDFIAVFENFQGILVKKNEKYALLNRYDLSEIIPYSKNKIDVDERKNLTTIKYKNKKYILGLGKLIEVKSED